MIDPEQVREEVRLLQQRRRRGISHDDEWVLNVKILRAVRDVAKLIWRTKNALWLVNVTLPWRAWRARRKNRKHETS